MVYQGNDEIENSKEMTLNNRDQDNDNNLSNIKMSESKRKEKKGQEYSKNERE